MEKKVRIYINYDVSMKTNLVQAGEIRQTRSQRNKLHINYAVDFSYNVRGNERQEINSNQLEH